MYTMNSTFCRSPGKVGSRLAGLNMNILCSCLPVEGGDPTEFHFHLGNVDQELVDAIDIGDQDDLKKANDDGGNEVKGRKVCKY